jgi:CDP-glucose 4,6-dehydratase
VLVTGHNGFKGSWLCLWLQALGARVHGVSLAAPPSSPSLYELARVGEGMESTLACDVRDAPTLARAVADTDCEVVFHLAAQPLVRRSLREPADTYAVNALGTANLLDAVLAAPSVRAVVVVTSDKCYAPAPDGRRHREEDPLGGRDPYSSSKACAELVVAAYRESLFAGAAGAHAPARLATARAGNVIGGGDFGEDRLLPDLFRALAEARPLRVRNPGAVRPWQHVLSPLSGYLALAQALCESAEHARAYNFGPRPEDEVTVAEVLELVDGLWPGGIEWQADPEEHPAENPSLRLDSGRAEAALGWRPLLSLCEAVELTVAWQQAYLAGEDLRELTLSQVAETAAPTRRVRSRSL